MPRRFLPFLFIFSGLATAQQPGPQVFTFFSEVDDTDQPYALYLPKDYSPDVQYPLVLSLHGAWSNHRLNLRRVFGEGNRGGETDAEATRYFPMLPDVPFIVASPLARGTMGYTMFAESDAWAVLADVRRRFRIDPDRIYLTGLSMGGGGTLHLGLSRPDVFAAIAPVCPAAFNQELRKAGNAVNLPVWLHHGDKDPVVPVKTSRDFHLYMREYGVPVEYTEYPGVRHDSWNNAYQNAQIFQWFAKHKRNRYPNRVRFTTDTYRYDGAYWVRLTRLTPGRAAMVDAVFVGPNEINFITNDLDGLAFELKGHPQFDASKPLLIRADGGELTLPAGAPLAVQRNGKGEWEAGAGLPAAGEKEPGFEGPVAAAFYGRHIYVYGTKDNPSADELRRRMQEAERAANWDLPNVRQLYFPRVLADKQVRESDIKEGSLILFGDASTNSQVEAFGARAPMMLKEGVKDYGLIQVLPGEAEGRYVVINSGLPFHTAGGLTGIPYLSAQANVLNRLPDFLLFKGTVINVVSSGRFDNQWQIPSAEKQKLLGSGVVEVR